MYWAYGHWNTFCLVGCCFSIWGKCSMEQLSSLAFRKSSLSSSSKAWRGKARVRLTLFFSPTMMTAIVVDVTLAVATARGALLGVWIHAGASYTHKTNAARIARANSAHDANWMIDWPSILSRSLRGHPDTLQQNEELQSNALLRARGQFPNK